jgi:type III secretory pathway lipoprotein EscJ
MTNLCSLGISLRKKLGKERISNVNCVFSANKIVTYTKSKNWEMKWLPVQMSCLVIYSHKSTVNNESNINHISSLVHLTFKVLFVHIFLIYHM